MRPAAIQCRDRPTMLANMGKKKVPRRVPFLTAKLRLAAAGAGQELLVQVGAVTGVATTPAEDRVSAHIGRGHRDRRRTGAGALQRNQGDDGAVDGRGNGGSKALYRHKQPTVGVGLNQ